MNADTPDWQTKETSAALDEQRRHPMPYPPTKAEQQKDDFRSDELYDAFMRWKAIKEMD